MEKMCNTFIPIFLFSLLFAVPRLTKAASIPHDEAWCYNLDNCAADSNEEILPDEWEGDCNIGKTQSPINIQTKNALESKKEIELIFNENYIQDHKNAVIINNGHTAEIVLSEEDDSKLEGGMGSYVFKQLHFHWGKDDSNGSEHQINGQSHQMEMHLVHLNSKFKSPTEALKLGKSKLDRKRAMMVIAIFLTDHGEKDNPAFLPITDSLKGGLNLRTPQIETNVTKILKSPINVMKMLPKDMSFYEYEGSLTTPLCYEIVHWAVVYKSIQISKAQMDAFRNVRTFENKKIAGNFRPVMPMNDRKLTFHSKVKVTNGSNNLMRSFDFRLTMGLFLIGFVLQS